MQKGGASTVQASRRSQQMRRATTQRKLLDSAVECIAAYGLAGVSVPLIAKNAGVTTGAVQHHFGSREALLIAVVADFAAKLKAQADQKRIDLNAPISDRVAAICKETWEIFDTNHFTASLEILIALRHDVHFFPTFLELLQTIETELDRGWIAYFAGRGLSDSTLAALRHLMQASLRGLVIRRLFRSERTSWETERQLLQTMLTNFFVSMECNAMPPESS